MTWDSTPWAVGGGASLPAEILRLLGHAATSGAKGIVTPGDLKVRAQTVPAGSVLVGPGAVVIPNTYSGAGSAQSYIGRNPTDDTVAVPATGGSARSDLIVARVLDPQYEGSPPADPTTFQYMRTERIQGVPAGTTSVDSLGLTYPAYALARIDIPANTGAITNAMIADLRALAGPRQWREVFATTITSEAGAYLPTNGVWTAFPSGYAPQVRVPSWATHATVIATVASFQVYDGNADGSLRVKLGALAGPNSVLDYDNLAGQYTRETAMTSAEFDVTALRGTLQAIVTEASLSGGSVRVRPGTHVVYDVQFHERAV